MDNPMIEVKLCENNVGAEALQCSTPATIDCEINWNQHD